MAQQNLFSEREKEVVGLLLQGKSNKQIALALGISESTVEFHLKNIYIKLQVSSRTEAVLKFSESHLRESIGTATDDKQGNSIVEGEDETADNGDKSISRRRILVKKTFYIVSAGLLTAVLLVVLVYLIMSIKGQMKFATPVPLTLTPAYAVLSPIKISKGNITYETVATLTKSEFRFELDRIHSPSPVNQFPSSGGSQDFLKNVEFVYPEIGGKLELEKIQGFGGADEAGNEIQGYVYRVNSPLTIGQKIHITAIVTFENFTGISEPVPFELDLTVEEEPPQSGG
jgi:DNA-binding CsgD family transcriptional regulator